MIKLIKIQDEIYSMEKLYKDAPKDMSEVMVIIQKRLENKDLLLMEVLRNSFIQMNEFFVTTHDDFLRKNKGLLEKAEALENSKVKKRNQMINGLYQTVDSYKNEGKDVPNMIYELIKENTDNKPTEEEMREYIKLSKEVSKEKVKIPFTVYKNDRLFSNNTKKDEGSISFLNIVDKSLNNTSIEEFSKNLNLNVLFTDNRYNLTLTHFIEKVIFTVLSEFYRLDKSEIQYFE